MTSLDDFLKEGRLGTLSEGQTVEDVQNLLGHPDGVSEGKWPRLWKYGSLQLGFYRPSRDESPFLNFIGLYFRSPEESPPDALAFSGWYPPVGCSYAEFREHLDDVGLGVSGGVTSGPNKHLIVGPGVRVTFDEDRLDSVQHTARREPDRKSLTISMSRAVWDTIRNEARSRGVSPSTLCANWIEERGKSLAHPVPSVAAEHSSSFVSLPENAP